MEAPKKIYLQICGECKDNDCKNCKFEDLEDNVTWCKDKIFDKDIEYIRTDAFIEKAVKFMCNCIEDEMSRHLETWHPDMKVKTIERFKNYMKGE